MGTRSYIGILNSDSTVTAVYCHWDGYPSNNGKILLESYNDPIKIATLLSFGSISSLGEKIGTKHDFEKRPQDECTFYNRDRGEDWNSVKPKMYTSIQGFLQKCNEDYAYLFQNNKWFFRAWDDDLEELTLEKCVD